MKKHSLGIWPILALLFLPFLLPAQVKVIDNIKPSKFFGIYEMKGFGYFMCYKHEREDVLELYNYELNPIRRVPLDFTVKESSFMHGVSNGKAFLLTYFDTEKDRKRIISFDEKLNKTAEIITKDEISDVFGIDDKSFGILTTKGKGNVFTVYDNALNVVKSTIFGEGYGLNISSLEGKASWSSVTSGPTVPLMSPANFRAYAGHSDQMVLFGAKRKGLKYAGSQIFVFDKQGNLSYEYELPADKYFPLGGYIQNGNLYFMASEGKYDGRPRDSETTNFVTLVIDGEGKLKERVVQDKVLGQGTAPLDIVLGPDGAMVVCMAMKQIDKGLKVTSFGSQGIGFSNLPNFQFYFEFLYFDNNGKLLNIQKVNKKSGEEDMIYAHNYCHTGETADGQRVYVVYYSNDDNQLSFHAAFSDQQGVSPPHSEEVYKDDTKVDKAEKISINWFNAFPAEPGKVVVSYYSAKKKSVLMAKVDVSAIDEKGGNGVKKN